MLEIALIYLAAALFSVTIAKRVGLGSVLGYLIAGMLIGPYLLGLVGDQTDVMHFAEFGVVMMLFLVGLELQPSRLWKLRHSILGLGGLQVSITTMVIFSVCLFVFELPWQSALAIGLMLALSSTAIVLQTLSEKGWIQQEAGQNSFSVLLFQDIAVIPILALLPLLAFTDFPTTTAHNNITASLPAYLQVAVSITVIIGIILAGKYISAPLFRYIADTRLRELFTVFALFLVISIAFIMQSIGLSPALGTFLAGVVLAESEFRHELEADIEPFKGLLLGLFFITVGASINFPLLFEQLALVLMLVIGLIAIKASVLFMLAKLFKMQTKQKWLFALALAQGGEFAFVLLSLTNSLHILSPEQGEMTTLVVAISMLTAPLLLIFYDKVLNKQDTTELADFDKPTDIEATQHVIIAGYGRFGQIVGRLLSAQGYHISVLDHSPSQIEVLRRFGNKVFYGDAARQDLLEASGAKNARMLVIAVDNPDKIIEIATLARKHYPHLKIVARAVDRRHAYELIRIGVSHFKRETFDSALNLGVDALTLLGHSQADSERAGQLFSKHDNESLTLLADLWGDDHSYGVAVKQRSEDLRQVLAKDKQQQDKLNTCHGEDG